MSEPKKNLFLELLQKGGEAIKEPFTIKRAKRAFEAAYDQARSAGEDCGLAEVTLREKLVEAASQKDGNLSNILQEMAENARKKEDAEFLAAFVAEEHEALFGEKLRA